VGVVGLGVGGGGWGGSGHRIFNFFMFPLRVKGASSQYVPKGDFNSTTP